MGALAGCESEVATPEVQKVELWSPRNGPQLRGANIYSSVWANLDRLVEYVRRANFFVVIAFRTGPGEAYAFCHQGPACVSCLYSRECDIDGDEVEDRFDRDGIDRLFGIQDDYAQLVALP